jgi:hypothetical protein
MNKESSIKSLRFTSIIAQIDDAVFPLVTRKEKTESEKVLETLQMLAIKRIVRANGI